MDSNNMSETEKLEALKEILVADMERLAESCRKAGLRDMKLTLVARHPSNDNLFVVLTEDDVPAVTGLLLDAKKKGATV